MRLNDLFGKKEKKETSAGLLLENLKKHNKLKREEEKAFFNSSKYKEGIKKLEKSVNLMPTYIQEKVTEFNVNGALYTVGDFLKLAYNSAKTLKKDKMEKYLSYLERNLINLPEQEKSRVRETMPKIREEYKSRLKKKY